MLPEIERVDQELEQATQRKRDVIAEVQKNCSHPIEAVRECDYRKSESDWFYCSPPMRVCVLCGLSEEGWGCGYKRLAPGVFKVQEIDRQELYKFRRLL